MSPSLGPSNVVPTSLSCHRVTSAAMCRMHVRIEISGLHVTESDALNPLFGTLTIR